MNNEGLDAYKVKPSKVYGKIIMLLLFALQALCAVIISSAYNSFTSLELAHDKHSEELEFLDKTGAVMASKITELQEQVDMLQSYILSNPQSGVRNKIGRK